MYVRFGTKTLPNEVSKEIGMVILLANSIPLPLELLFRTHKNMQLNHSSGAIWLSPMVLSALLQKIVGEFFLILRRGGKFGGNFAGFFLNAAKGGCGLGGV